MRRISLALALLGAAAAGCSGGSTSGQGGARGVAEGTFTVTIQNGQNGNTSLAITGGYVTSSPAGIDCGEGAHAVCSFDFPSTAAVTLTAVRTTGTFYGWAADCSGVANTCVLDAGKADRYVLANFTQFTGHPNWTPTASTTDTEEHGTQARNLLAAIPFTSPWKCAACHGGSLEGAGFAPSCADCHAPAARAEGETCRGCHAGQGSAHQATYNKYADTPTLVATINSVVSTPDPAPATTFTVVVTFTLTKDGQPYGNATLSGLGQKRYAAIRYDATNLFETASAISFGSLAPTATPGRYTVRKAGAAFAPELSNSFVYLYFAENPTLVPAKGHYRLYDNVADVGQVFGTIGWTSTANVSACEQCHGSPYMKHGYRAGAVDGLPDMLACKACHTDQRAGVDFNLAMSYDDPLEMLRIMALPPVGGEPPWTLEVEELYGYTATTMADTHISHAKEFLYPQSMANCATCHAGKLDRILTDANFTGGVCKSCHPISDVVVEDPKRAPKLEPAYHDIDWAKGVLVQTDNTTVPPTVIESQCNECHYAGNTMWGGAPVFSQLHSGYDRIIYNTAGAKYPITSSIDSASFNATTNVVTATVSMAGLAANAIVKPTVVVSLYGYGTKDFVLSGHSSISGAVDPVCPNVGGTRGTYNLEYTYGATQRTSATNPCSGQAATSSRLQLTPAAPTAGTTSWTVTADLTRWASKIASGQVSRIEVAFLPGVGIDQAVVVQNDATRAGYNPMIAAGGVSREISLAGAGSLVDNAVAYGRNIVDAARCNKCHDALGTTFHSPNYGSAGVIGCRVCHTVNDGGGHLEMQSRSIDSYVHAIHSMEAFDIGTINFADELSAFKYEHHTESTYPNFTTLNCESCHNPGTYEAPANTTSLPGILSASAVLTGKSRAIGNVPSVVTGPAARACGGCHRAELIKEDDATALREFDAHTKAFGYREADPDGTGPVTTTTILNDIINAIFTP